MKRIIIMLVIFIVPILLFSPPIIHLVTEDSSPILSGDRVISTSFVPIPNLSFEIIILNEVQQIAKQGCCSWHGGVCGCVDGRVLCCDGTLSPTCTCNHDTSLN